MAGKGARYRRQIRRARQLGRGIVREDDLAAVIGMTLDEVHKYAEENNLKVRICKTDGINEIHDGNVDTDLLSLDIKDGLITKATSSVRIPKPEFFKIIDDVETMDDSVEIIACPNEVVKL